MHYPREDSFTDQYLVEQVLKGDQLAFARIMRQTKGLVVQIVFKMVPTPGDRQDIVQDVYLKAFRSLPDFRFNAKLSNWLAKITYNTCLNYLQKKKLVFLPDYGEEEDLQEERLEQLNQKQQHQSQNDTERVLSARELSSILGTAIKTLSPPIYHTLITLYHQEELSYAEIAEITSLPEGTVKSYLFRARKALKANLLSKYKKEEL